VVPARLRSSAWLVALASAFIARAPDAHADGASPSSREVASLIAAITRDARDAREPARAADLVAPTPVELGAWKGASGCSYLAPKSGYVDAEGGVDVVFHFHAGQMTEKELRAVGMNAVFVSCGYGIGSGAYSDAFASTARFDRMVAEVVKSLAKDSGRRDVHVRKLALASWSAGFAAVGKILAVDRYYAMVDAVILNDSLHAGYLDPNPKTPGQGAARVNVKMLAPFVRFAKDAKDGAKAMVVTHSAILPPDYASSTEATEAMLTAIGVPIRAIEATNERGMTMVRAADVGGLHVRGFKGRGPRDHFDHLHLLGEALQSRLVPRWKREERLVYTLAGEQL